MRFINKKNAVKIINNIDNKTHNELQFYNIIITQLYLHIFYQLCIHPMGKVLHNLPFNIIY